MEEMIREMVEEVMGDEVRCCVEELLKDAIKEKVCDWYCENNLRNEVKDLIDENLSISDIEYVIRDMVGDIVNEAMDR